MASVWWRRDLGLARVLPVLVILAFLVACGGEVAEEAACSDCNVVLIVADTLRADRLGAYGYERPTSPFFDRFAKRGVLFEQTRTPAACTFPAVNSLLTSRSTFVFLDEATRPAIPDSVRSLPEMLAPGRRSLAISASPVVRATPSKHNPKGGYGRGFEIFDETLEWAHGTLVTEKAVELVESVEDEPFFLYLHYMDPHDPYIPLAQHQGMFSEPYEGPHDFIAKGDPNPISALIREKRLKEEIEPGRDISHLSDLYDETVRSFDTALEKLIKGLDKKGLLDETLVIVTSDHGEAFLEHGLVKHCYTVFENEVHVPMLFVGPGISGGRANVSASLLDVVPTILDYLGIEEGSELEGGSLRPWLDDPQTPGPRFAFSKMGVFRSVSDGEYKLIRHLAADRYGLFDVREDPGEKNDVLEDKRRDFFRLRSELQSWIKAHEGEKTASEQEKLAREIEEELRSLGYLG